MTRTTRIRLIRLLVLLMGLMTIASLLAQDVTEIPPTLPNTTLPPAEVTIQSETGESTTLPIESPTESVPVVPTQTESPVATETEAATQEAPVLTSLPVESTPTSQGVLAQPFAAEPPMTLMIRDLFEDGVIPAHWAFPSEWTFISTSDGSAVRIGAVSTGVLHGTYADVAVMGYFTFIDHIGAAQITVRESAESAYYVTLEASGFVSLSKRDATGAITILASAVVSDSVDVMHSLRLSVVGDVLRVAVDDEERIAVQDAAPLPAGGVSLGSVSGALLFDNFFLWVSAASAPTPILPTTESDVTAVPPTDNPNPIVSSTGKSTILQTAPHAIGVMSSSNDAFAARLIATGVPYGHSGDTLGNSTEADEPVPVCGFNITNTAWYEFTPPAGGLTNESFVITSAGSTFDTMIAVYTSASGTLNTLVPVAGGCSDDMVGSLQAQLTLSLSDTTRYYIQLGGYNGSVGIFSFAVLRPGDVAIPVAPVISAAAPGAATPPVTHTGKTNLQPVIAWASGSAIVPYSYEIQLSTSAAFSSLVDSAILLEPTRYMQISALPEPSLPAGQVYYWHVRARNFLGQTSPWSASYSFTLDRTAPPAPALMLPALNAAVTTVRPTFTWLAVPDVNRYALRVTTDSACSTPVSATFDVSAITTVAYTFATDLPQGAYWFCVSAQDVAGNASGFIGEKRRFVVNVALTPANAAALVPVSLATTANLTFTWAAVSGASYTLQVDNNADLSSPEVNQTLTTTTFTLAAQLYGTYYWRVRVNGDDLPAALARRVIISPALPLAPAIQVPGSIPNAGFTNDVTPMLDWTVPANWLTPPAGQSLMYEFQLSTNNTFTALAAPTVTGLTDSAYTWAAPLTATPGTVYYWRVRPVTSLGAVGPYSPIYSFTLDTVAPHAPTLLTAPADNTVSTMARPTFSWATSAGANGYSLELSAATDFNSLAYGSPYAATTPSLTLPISQPQGIEPLYWRVRAKDAAGNISVPSAYRALRIDYALTPLDGHTQTLVAPAIGVPVTFSWTLVTGLQGAVYNVIIYADAQMTQTVLTSGPLATATWTSPAVIPAGDYWWTLKVSDGAMGVSKPRRFVVSAPLPGAPAAPFAPVNVPTLDTMPEFNWAAPTLNPLSIVDYQLQISTAATFATQLAGSPYSITSAQLPFSLPSALPDTPGQVYYWRVRGRTALDVYGPFTAVQSFTLDTTAPAAPAILTAPTEQAVLKTARPTFSWAVVPGAKSYMIQIDNENGFADPLVQETTALIASSTSAFSLPQGTYFWRVWSIDAAGNMSNAPSAARSFVIDYRTAPAANMVVPTATTANVTFTWALVAGAPVGTTYTIELDANLDGTPETILPAVTTATVTAPALTPADYRYRLVVSNGFGTSGWMRFVVSPLLPGAPTAPFAPLNVPVNDTTPTLQWGVPAINASNITSYVVEVSTVATFASQLSGSPFDVSTGTSFTLPTLPNSPVQLYYWRVRAKAAFNLMGAYSPTQTFTLDTTAPTPPATLTAPLDNALITNALPAFSWPAALGANRYMFQLTQDSSDFNPLVFPEITTTALSAGIPATTYLQQGTYYWRVWSQDAAGNRSTTASPVRALIVNYSLIPAANAVLVSPAAAHVTFKWAVVPGGSANTIRIQIDDSSDFSSPIRTSPILASTATTYVTSLAGSTPNTNPLPYGKYYWRVIVTGNANLPAALANSFTMSPAVPQAPTLSTTTPTAITADTTPGFGWTAVTSPSGATVTGYDFQLSTVSTFATLVGPMVRVTGLNHMWSPALPNSSGQKYYIRVRAVTNLGTVSAWSPVRVFTLDTDTPLASPGLIAPAANGSVTTPRPAFQWSAVTGAVRYEIRYGTQPNLSAIPPTSVSAVTHVPTGDLPLTNIYWEVRAIDAAGNIGPYSAQRIVKITSAVGAAPGLWGFSDNTPPLTWTALTWPATYTVEVSRNTTFTDIVWQSTTISASTPQVDVGVPLGNGTYYWRVRGQHPAANGGALGPWSTVNSFAVAVP